MDNRVAKEQTENWIDYIIDKTVGNYQGREIVIWGKYKIADSIKMKLLKQYGLSVAFYVDSSQEKQDGKTVFSPDVLCGKSNSYYVIIPLAFYQEIREKLVGGGMNQIGIIIIFAIVLYVRSTIIMRTGTGIELLVITRGLSLHLLAFIQ